MAINPLTTMRFTGLSSGMDTDTIIQNMMKIEQFKVNRELRARSMIEWRQEALNNVTTDLKLFKNTFMSALSEKNMMTSSAYTQFNVATTDKNDALTVTANAEAMAGKITIKSIDQLAKTTTVTTQNANGNKVSKTGEGVSEGNYVALKDLDLFRGINFVDGKLSFSINDQEFEFSKDDTLHDMMATINASAEAGVNFTYSRITDRFTISSKTSGADTEINLKNLAGNAFGPNGAFGIDTGKHANGQNAIMVIADEGFEDIVIERDNNKFSIEGVQYNLLKETSDPIDITLTKDIEPAVAKVKEFIEGYNTLIKKLNDMLDTRKTNSEKSYTPLTDEEKANMTDSQIEQWESIAKKGLLSNDRDIRTVLDNVRAAFYESVESAGLSAADIGLRTSYDWKLKGEIEINEDALRQALINDSSKVMNVFMAQPTSEAGSSAAYKESGLLVRIGSIIDNYTSNTQANTLDSMDRNLRNLDSKILNMQNKMIELEERYYLKFAAMEKALAQLESQTSWVGSMLNSASKS